MTFQIVRFYQNAPSLNGEHVKTLDTLEEAQEHCTDPETSSRTCTNEAGQERTRRHGAWFEGYRET